jgi:alkanesulfonate monooxygenase SsuD/methylene tetrahydromethanopterin reductase-like flavin-dependent oxidoreductase (luciferase family)
VNPWPRPLQQPHPPIWIPGSGSVETIEWVAQHRYTFVAIPFSPLQVVKNHFDTLRAYAWEKLNYEVDPHQVGWPAFIYVAETDEQARKEFEEPVWYLAKKLLRMPREYMFPPGHTSVNSLLRVTGENRRFITTLTSWREVEEGQYVICGSPKTVLQQLREGIKTLNCRILLTSFQLGNLPHHLALKNMELFAREVMPHLRAEFP